MLISEIFASRQGEGSHIGMKAIFLRLFGCQLNCAFCDTPQGKDDGHPLSELSISDIVVRLYDLRKETGISTVVITGGEPGEQYAELNDLARELSNREFILHLETNGRHKGVLYSMFDLVTVSPKSNDLAWEKLHMAKTLEFKFLHDMGDTDGSVNLFNGVTQTARQKWGYSPLVTVQVIDKNYTADEQLKALEILINEDRYNDARLLPQLHKLVRIK